MILSLSTRTVNGQKFFSTPLPLNAGSPAYCESLKAQLENVANGHYVSRYGEGARALTSDPLAMRWLTDANKNHFFTSDEINPQAHPVDAAAIFVARVLTKLFFSSSYPLFSDQRVANKVKDAWIDLVAETLMLRGSALSAESAALPFPDDVSRALFVDEKLKIQLGAKSVGSRLRTLPRLEMEFVETDVFDSYQSRKEKQGVWYVLGYSSKFTVILKEAKMVTNWTSADYVSCVASTLLQAIGLVGLSPRDALLTSVISPELQAAKTLRETGRFSFVNFDFFSVPLLIRQEQKPSAAVRWDVTNLAIGPFQSRTDYGLGLIKIAPSSAAQFSNLVLRFFPERGYTDPVLLMMNCAFLRADVMPTAFYELISYLAASPVRKGTSIDDLSRDRLFTCHDTDLAVPDRSSLSQPILHLPGATWQLGNAAQLEWRVDNLVRSLYDLPDPKAGSDGYKASRARSFKQLKAEYSVFSRSGASGAAVFKYWRDRHRISDRQIDSWASSFRLLFCRLTGVSTKTLEDLTALRNLLPFVYSPGLPLPDSLRTNLLRAGISDFPDHANLKPDELIPAFDKLMDLISAQSFSNETKQEIEFLTSLDPSNVVDRIADEQRESIIRETDLPSYLASKMGISPDSHPVAKWLLDYTDTRYRPPRDLRQPERIILNATKVVFRRYIQADSNDFMSRESITVNVLADTREQLSDRDSIDRQLHESAPDAWVFNDALVNTGPDTVGLAVDNEDWSGLSGSVDGSVYLRKRSSLRRISKGRF